MNHSTNTTLFALGALLLTAACQVDDPQAPSSPGSSTSATSATGAVASTSRDGKTSGEHAPTAIPGARGSALATFAGGCFWCVEKPFEKVPGVTAVVSGYTGGQIDEPTYRAVGRGITGHTEAVQVHYDPRIVSYDDLLEVFWRQIDPTDIDGQFVDRGDQYRPEIFVSDEAQRQAAEASRARLAASGRFDDPIVVPITELGAWWDAEEYHQDYYKKSPADYESYRRGSGRDPYLERVWGDERHWLPTPRELEVSAPDAGMQPTSASWMSFEKPTEAQLRKQLTELQFEVTQQDATERAFRNEYHDNKQPGIYVDIVSGEPLFCSTDKFDSGSGWPSFTRPLMPENIQDDTDYKLGYARTEVRSTHADSHLGHVFEDGPQPTGLRYCINSAALRFIPAPELESAGYGQFTARFESSK